MPIYSNIKRDLNDLLQSILEFTVYQSEYFLLDQIWSILPALELLPLEPQAKGGLNNQGRATPMQVKWIKLDLIFCLMYRKGVGKPPIPVIQKAYPM